MWGGILAAAAAFAHGLFLMLPAYRHGFDWLFGIFLQPLLTSKDAPPAPSLVIRAHVALVCIYALIIGISTPVWSNALLWAAKHSRMSLLVRLNLAAITDPMEGLLSRSLVNGEAIQVTLSTGKVYVGYVLEALDPDLPTKFIKLQPLMSGQRGGDGQVEYTTFYDQILMEFEANPDTKADVDSFQQVIPVDKVASLSGFSLDAYVRFLAERQERMDSEPTEADAAASGAVAAVPWLALAGGVLTYLMR